MTRFAWSFLVLAVGVACNASSVGGVPGVDAASGTDDDVPDDDVPSPNGGGGSIPVGTVMGPGTDPSDAGRGLDAAKPTQPLPPLRLSFEEIPLAGDADFITDFVFLPGGEELFATSKEGIVFHLALEAGETRVLGEFDLETVYSERDCGLISLALDPSFDENQLLYVGFCTDVRTSGVYRVTFNEDYDAIADSMVEIVSVGGDPIAAQNERPWHNVGALSFASDGVLWVPFGDKVRFDVAQDTTNHLGALLRIVPSREPGEGGFLPASDNPFLGDGQDSGAVYAYGLRSPWRGTLDHRGRYFVGDVGSDFQEEINMVQAPAANFGWPIAEGPCTMGCNGLTDPLTSWDRSLDHPYVLDDSEANPIPGRVANVGVEYVGSDGDPYGGRLHHHVLFSDFCVGWIRALHVDDEGQLLTDEYVGHLNHASSWRQGDDGYLYVMTYGRCQTDRENVSDTASRLYRVVPAN